MTALVDAGDEETYCRIGCAAWGQSNLHRWIGDSHE